MLSTYSIIFTASDGTVIDGELETAAPLPTGGWTLTLNAAGNGFAAAPVVVIPPAPPPVTQVATPVFSPLPPGPGTIPLKVTITTPTIAAAIYYTTDGVKPTYPPTGATKLYNPATGVVIDTTAYDPYCVYAIAVAPGLTNSALATGNYVFSAPTTVATPTFSPTWRDCLGWGKSHARLRNCWGFNVLHYGWQHPLTQSAVRRSSIQIPSLLQ